MSPLIWHPWRSSAVCWRYDRESMFSSRSLSSCPHLLTSRPPVASIFIFWLTTKDPKISDLECLLLKARCPLLRRVSLLSDIQVSLSSTEKELVALHKDYASRELKLSLTNWSFPPSKPTNRSLPSKLNRNKKPTSLIPQKPDCQTHNSNSALTTPTQKFWSRGKWRKLEEAAKACEIKDELVKKFAARVGRSERGICLCVNFNGRELVDG